MKKLILLLLFALPISVFGQAYYNFGMVFPRNTDTARTFNTLLLPKYANEDGTKFLTTDERGLLILVTVPGGGGDADSSIFSTVYGVDTAKEAIRGQIITSAIANQSDTTQTATFKINSTGTAGNFVATKADAAGVVVTNTNTTTTTYPFISLGVTGQNTGGLSLVPRNATISLNQPWTIGARGTSLLHQSPGNTYFRNLKSTGLDADYTFYVSDGSGDPTLANADSLFKIKHDGTAYLYHAPALGTGDTVLKWNSVTKAIDRVVVSGGGGSPAGSDTYVQFNDGGSFGADIGLSYNKTTDALTLRGPQYSTIAGNATYWYGTPDNYLTSYGTAGTAGRAISNWTINAVNPGSGRPNVVYDFFSYKDGDGTAGNASFRFAGETHYEMLGGEWFEFHLPEIFLENATGSRLWSIYANKITEDNYLQSTIKSFSYFTDYQADPGTYYYLNYNNTTATAEQELNSFSNTGADDALSSFKLQAFEDDRATLLNRLTIRTNELETDISTPLNIRFSNSPGGGGILIDPANTAIAIGAASSGNNLHVEGKTYLQELISINGIESFTRNYATTGGLGYEGGIVMDYTITDINTGNNSQYGFLQIQPTISVASSLPSAGNRIISASPAFTASGGSIDIERMTMVDLGPSYTDFRNITTRGVYFHPTYSGLSSAATIAFENTRGDNYLNSVNEATGVGYTTGAALAEKFNVNGNALVEGAFYLSEISAPSTPATGYGALYEKSDGKIYFKNDAGTEYDLTGGGGGGGMAIGDAVSGGTSGSVLFVDAAGELAQDNADFFWDATNERLGIGVAAPTDKIEVDGNITSGGGITVALPGTTKYRIGSLGSVIPDWAGQFVNMKYNEATDEWNADDDTKVSGFIKFDVRDAHQEISIFRQPATANPRGGGTPVPIAQFKLSTGDVLFSQDIELLTAGEGIFLKSPDGTRHKITVTNAGTLDVTVTP